MIDAGKYFLRRQKRSLAISEREIIHIACKSLGLNELSEFKPEERVIEYMIDNNDKNLSEKSIKKFAELTSSESRPGRRFNFGLLWCIGCISRNYGCKPISSQKRLG